MSASDVDLEMFKSLWPMSSVNRSSIIRSTNESHNVGKLVYHMYGVGNKAFVKKNWLYAEAKEFFDFLGEQTPTYSIPFTPFLSSKRRYTRSSAAKSAADIYNGVVEEMRGYSMDFMYGKLVGEMTRFMLADALGDAVKDNIVLQYNYVGSFVRSIKSAGVGLDSFVDFDGFSIMASEDVYIQVIVLRFKKEYCFFSVSKDIDGNLVVSKDTVLHRDGSDVYDTALRMLNKHFSQFVESVVKLHKD